jgi:aspartate ammonia-lyase
LLASDVRGTKEIEIPARQTGSSIMPGKINPVIPEFVVSVAHKIYANDVLITSLSAQGCLELNAYIPVIGHALIESLKLLISANNTLKNNLFQDLKINNQITKEILYNSPVITTALVPYIGYGKASELAKMMKFKSIDIFQAAEKHRILNKEKIEKILSTDNLLKSGFSINDLL